MLESGYIAYRDGSNAYFNADPSPYFKAIGETAVLSADNIDLFPRIQDIQLYNAVGYCSQIDCGQSMTHYVEVSNPFLHRPYGIKSGTFIVGFCWKHAAYFTGVYNSLNTIIHENKNSRKTSKSVE